MGAHAADCCGGHPGGRRGELGGPLVDDDPGHDQVNPADAVEEKLMAEALRLAARAAEAGEVPVGAVIVHGGQVIARAHVPEPTRCSV